MWISAAVVLLVALIVSGSTRVRVIIAVLLVALLATGAILRVTSEHQHNVQQTVVTPPAAPVSASAPVAAESVGIADLKMTGSGAPWEVSGTVSNKLGTQALRSVTLRITRSDCYEGALDPSGCVLLWQGDPLVEVRVPPDEHRAFVSRIWPHGTIARAKGQARDEFKVIAATADRAP
jgi:hypothetical protein